MIYHRERWALGSLLVAVDTTIISVAVPRISTEFKALYDIGWYGSAYLATLTAFQPTMSNIYKVFSPKAAYIGSIVLFESELSKFNSFKHPSAFSVHRIQGGSTLPYFPVFGFQERHSARFIPKHNLILSALASPSLHGPVCHFFLSLSIHRMSISSFLSTTFWQYLESIPTARIISDNMSALLLRSIIISDLFNIS